MTTNNISLSQSDTSGFAKTECFKIAFIILFGCIGLAFYANTSIPKEYNPPFSIITSNKIPKSETYKLPEELNPKVRMVNDAAE
ncbi:MAG: hypothetical protein ACI8P3_004576 [Saprospiraceae bacterium]|jgi:hypothetical protein